MPVALPFKPLLLIVFCAVYLLTGLVGHDPWKVDDAVHLGVAYEFFLDGHWLAPRIGHDPWLVTPPLFHWIAALLGLLLSPLIAFHNAARLATALAGALLFLALSRTAQRLHGDKAGLGAPVLAMGCVGLLLPIHEAQPMIGLLAAQAGLFLALARLAAGGPRNVVLGALGAALALAAGLLCAGATALLPLVTPFLLVPLHRDWRGMRLPALFLALLLGLGLATLWPLALLNESPMLMSSFLSIEQAKLTPPPWSYEEFKAHLELLGWAAWPLLPLAAWALWSGRRQLGTPGFFLPLAGLLPALVQVFLLPEPRYLNHLLLLAPLVLLASAGVDRLRRGAANAYDWFGLMTFTLIAGLVWLGGVAMMTGAPARVARNFTKSEPGFAGEFSWTAIAAGTVLSLLWIASLWNLPKSPWRSSARWAGGMTLMWGLLAALWMPWMNYGKTYRPVAEALGRALGDSEACVFGHNLGDAQKASLRYFIGLAPKPYQTRSRACDLLLVQGSSRSDNPQPGWRKIWEGNRAGDKSEKLRLFRRIG